MRFYLTSCRFVIKPLGTLVLPEYKGVVLRGGLGTVFKDLVCIKRDRDCGTCLISDTCAYFKIFETPVPKGAAMMRKYPYAPHPFVITPPLTPQTEFAPSDEVSFELTLIGRAVDYLPYFIYTFEEFGRRGIGKDRIPFQLIRVQSVKDGSSAPSKVIYSSATGKMADPAPVIDLGDLEAEGKYLSIGPGPVDVTIRFQTPVNVVTLGHIDHVLSFSSFMKSLVRRIKLLQHFHCLDDARAPQMSPCGISSPEPPKPRSSSASKASSMGQNPDTPRSGADPAGKDEPQGLITQKLESHLLSLADQATTADRQLKWIGQSRKSGHSGDPMTLSGFVGEMKYRFTNIEPLAELFPYLCVGEYIHIGKHTGFGLGKYSVQTTGTPELPERQT